MRIGIVGLGKMGETIARGLLGAEDARQFQIQATTRTLESAHGASKRVGIECHADNGKLISECEIVILAVKPHQAQRVLNENKERFRKDQLVLSVCASLTTEQLHAWTGSRSGIIRAMPNTPCLIGEGMTVFAPGPGAQAKHLAVAEKIFGRLGKTAIVEESLMDGVTGLSGCGPAYAYVMIEALSDAGVKVGLSRETATLLAAQTLAGAAKMVLEKEDHPAALKDEVATPAGCTIDGLMALEEGKLRVTLIKAVVAAAKRSRALRGVDA